MSLQGKECGPTPVGEEPIGDLLALTKLKTQ